MSYAGFKSRTPLSPTTTFAPSEQQSAIINWASNSSGHLICQARAGCGKTSLLMMLLPYLDGEVFIGAYNKAIATELESRISSAGLSTQRYRASTFHSAGFSAWRYRNPRVKVEAKKVWQIVDSIVSSDRPASLVTTLTLYASATVTLVSLAKQHFPLTDTSPDSEWMALIDHFGIDLGNEDDEDSNMTAEYVIEAAKAIYRISLDQCSTVMDFDDMILAPLYFNSRIWPKDWVLIDEAQDTNPARRELALRMLKPSTGRLIAVGDDRQAIYGFAGASSDSLEIIQSTLNAVTLPLNHTYRCPKSVVAVANQWVPDLIAEDSNGEGIVRNINIADIFTESFRLDDAILCRNTAPLVTLAYQLLRKGIPCQIEGRDIAAGLTRLARRWKVKSLQAVCNHLATYREREVAKLLKAGRDARAEAVSDQVETLLTLAEKVQEDKSNAGTVDDLVSLLTSMFGDTQPGVKPRVLTLSTIHKSKGREWPRVFILGRNKFQPSPYARQYWQKHQECNLMYVAVTRAKVELVDIVIAASDKKKAKAKAKDATALAQAATTTTTTTTGAATAAPGAPNLPTEVSA